MLLEGFAQPVESKGVNTGIAEGQNPSEKGHDEMDARRVVITEWVVEIQDMIRQPAEGKQSYQDQYRSGNSLPGFYL